MIEVIGKKIILRYVIEEIKKSGLYSASAHKIPSSNDEICLFAFAILIKIWKSKKNLRQF